MKYLSVFLLIAILLSVIFSPSDTFADDPDGISKEKGVPGLYGEYVPNQLLVTFQGWLTAEQIQSMANSYGFQVVDKSVDGQVYKISMPAELLQETLDKLAKDPNVLLVQPNHLKGFGPPETAIPVSQLGLSGIQALAEGPITEKPLADGKQGEEPPGKERGGTKSPAGDEGAATKGTDGEWVSSDRLDSSSAPPLGGEWTAGEKDVKSDGAGSFQAQQVSVTTITFDEVASGTPINGQTIEGVTFSFLVDGQPSTDARADFGGPGNSPLMRPPLLEGDPRGTLGLAFADPPTSINFAFSLLVGGAIPDGATLKLFNASNQLIGTFFQAASVPGSFFFPEAAVGADSQVPIARAEITFFANAERFALDNLQLNAGTAFVPPQVTGDDHGNLSSTATPLAIGQATNGSIQAVGDVDYFSFQGQSGVTYIIDTTLNGLADSYIILYGTDGVSSIAHDDDSGPGLASRLVFEPQASGGYFVEVRPFNSSQLGGYAITVAALTGDDGNAAATATSLALGQDRIAEIKPAGDVDFFSFSAQAGKAYGIQTALISLADSLLFLYDLNGVTLLASDDDGGPRLASSLAFTAPQAGTYFVEVRTFAAEQTGVYSLRVVEYQDDHANGFAGATPLTAQVRAAGVIEVNADLDYFRFVATAGSYYMLNTDTGTLEDTVLFLYDRDGTTLLAFDDDSGTGYASRIIFKPDVSVTYIVAVGAFDGNDSGTYGITLQVIPDDHANTATGSTAVTMGFSTDGSIDVEGDVDTFSFSASAGGFYLVRTALFTLQDSVVFILASDGNTVLATDDDSGTGFSSLLVFQPPSAGTYFVQVRAFREFQTGTYTLMVAQRDGPLASTQLPPSPGPVVPNDPLYKNVNGFPGDLQRWYLGDGLLKAESAWGFTKGSNSIVVAVIDTGVYLAHPDLAGKMWINTREIPGNGLDDDHNGFVDDVNGWDFQSNDNNPNPDGPPFNSHGTMVAGVLGAATNNGIGVAGVLWQVKIMPLKVFGATGGATDFDVLNAITYAINNGANVINLSLGQILPEPAAISDPLFEEKITQVHNAGVVVVASAGNSNTSLPSTPASATHAISVGASDHGSAFLALGETPDVDGRARFSNFGEFVDVVAPGVFITTTGVTSTDASPGYFSVSGTSFSAPLVSGLAGLVLARGKSLGLNLSPYTVRLIIEEMAVDLPDDPDDVPDAGPDWDGKGMVNFLVAVQSVGVRTGLVAVPSVGVWGLLALAAALGGLTIVFTQRRLARHTQTST